ncbi:MAG TPA: NUDIX hydrolase [bacterium]|jgi:8-oxo-dGTP pyrophosphatase MutT (NUDIX family)|nr:NUDIX hydrolase [bacterium]
MLQRLTLAELLKHGRFDTVVDVDELLALWPEERTAVQAVLPLSRDYFDKWKSILVDAHNRRGEVVLIVQKPDDRILLHTKPFYPAGVFRLPTGGLKPEESINDGLVRELYEETGLAHREGWLIDMVFYDFTNNGIHLPFVSYLFQLPGIVREPVVQDVDEEISGFRWVAAKELQATGDELAALPEPWREWGRMRAIPHWAAAERLFSGESEIAKRFGTKGATKS